MIWFTSDLHLGHNNILKYAKRPFDTIEEHDAAIIKNWQDRVDDADTVYVVGDFTFYDPKDFDALFNKLPGKLFLIRGNHDPRPLAQHPRWEAVHPLTTLRRPPLDGNPNHPHIIVLCHYPFAIWENQHYGSWHLFGHTHNAYDPLTNPRSGLSLDVGVDNPVTDFGPISLDRVADIMATRTFKAFTDRKKQSNPHA